MRGRPGRARDSIPPSVVMETGGTREKPSRVCDGGRARSVSGVALVGSRSLVGPKNSRIEAVVEYHLSSSSSSPSPPTTTARAAALLLLLPLLLPLLPPPPLSPPPPPLLLLLLHPRRQCWGGDGGGGKTDRENDVAVRRGRRGKGR